ncbi:MAG: hypothetical protein Q7R93_04175 [bacterium]|nr:hypothetical protein [bacterium]
MSDFFTKYQLLVGIVIGSLIIGFFVYISNQSGDSGKLLETPQAITEPVTGTQIEEKNVSEITTQPKPAKAPAVTTPTWKVVTSFEGVGQKDTAPFQIRGSKWRIKWSCETMNGIFGLAVYGKSINGGDPGAEIVRTSCPFSGTNQYNAWNGYGPPDGFFLSILADKVDAQEYTSWKITVEELY